MKHGIIQLSKGLKIMNEKHIEKIDLVAYYEQFKDDVKKYGINYVLNNNYFNQYERELIKKIFG